MKNIVVDYSQSVSLLANVNSTIPLSLRNYRQAYRYRLLGINLDIPSAGGGSTMLAELQLGKPYGAATLVVPIWDMISTSRILLYQGIVGATGTPNPTINFGSPAANNGVLEVSNNYVLNLVLRCSVNFSVALVAQLNWEELNAM